MSPVRLLKRAEWEKRLTDRKCAKIDFGKDSGLETGEWWVTEHNKLFVVPCDPSGLLRSDDWQTVTVQLAKLKPPLDLES